MSGRLLKLPKPSSEAQTILFIYGLGSTIERVMPVATQLNKQAGVIVPDMPGFGGMEGLHKIGIKPDLDNVVDYIATIIKFHFPKKQRFTLAGLDYGFSIVNRLLQKFPEIHDRVDMVISFAGINDWHELQMPRLRARGHRAISTVLARQLPANLAHAALLVARPKLRANTPDLRTYLQARHSLLHLKKHQMKDPLTVHYFPGSDCLSVDQTRVLSNLRKMYKKVVVASEAELICTKDQVELRMLRRKRIFAWLKA